MTIRRSARWQWSLDDRILEHLRDESFSTAEWMAEVPGIHAPAVIIQERCEVLAEAELVAFVTDDCELVELTTTGQQYLDGKVDVALYPWPQHPALRMGD